MKGVRFVFIDDSTYEILPEQLEFYRSEAAKGEPVALMMHIALWFRGGGVANFGCAHPDWGAKTDPHWKIERRERWPQGHSATTFAFRRAVAETPNLLGVFCGHSHRYQHGQDGNLLQFITPSGAAGLRLLCSVNL